MHALAAHQASGPSRSAASASRRGSPRRDRGDARPCARSGGSRRPPRPSRRRGTSAERVDVAGSDELGRLATRFNGMLAALEESVGRQRRLVADASHELRTPLTAARTNVDLVREGKLPRRGGAARARRGVGRARLADLARLRPRRARARRGAQAAHRGRAARRSRLVGGRAREVAGTGGDVRHVARAGRRCVSTRSSSSARSGTCSTTRSSTARRGADRGVGARRRGGRRGPRAGHRRGGPAERSSTASTAPPPRAPSRAPASGSRSSARRRRRTAAPRPPRAAPPGRASGSRFPSRRSPKRLSRLETAQRQAQRKLRRARASRTPSGTWYLSGREPAPQP